MRIIAYGLIMSFVVGGAVLFTTGFAMKSSKEPDVKIVSQGNDEPWVNSEISPHEKKQVMSYLRAVKSKGPLDTSKDPDLQCCSSGWLVEKVEAKHALSIGGVRYARGDLLPTSIYHQAHTVPQDVAHEIPGPELSRLVLLDHKLVRVSSYSHTILDIAELPTSVER